MIQKLKTLLGNDRELLPLLAKVQALSALQRQFIRIAPPQLVEAGHLQVLSLLYGTLSISAANATIAAKLRQIAPELAAQMRQVGCEVSGIRVKVQVSFDRPRPIYVPKKLSKSARTAFTELSCMLDDQSPLKPALERMANPKSKQS